MILEKRASPHSLFLFSVLLLCGVLAYSQDASVDDLFSEGGDITEQTNSAQAEPSVESAKPLPYVLSGSITTTGGISAGYMYAPWDQRYSAELDFNAGLTASSTIALKSNLDTNFGYYVACVATFNPLSTGNAQWSNFLIDTVYCEYIMADYVFWKLGKFGFSWGQGRLFNPGNFMSSSASLYTIQAAIPTWLSGVTAYMQFSDSQFSGSSVPLYSSTVYALRIDLVAFDTYFGASGKWKPSEELDLLFSIKRTILGIDIHVDSTINAPNAGLLTGSLLAGFYKQWGNLHIYGEYELYNYNEPVNYSGLVIGYNNVGGYPIDPVVKWMHCWSDGSGTLNAGIKWDIVNHVKVETGLSFVYGVDASVYVVENTNPGGDRMMLAILVTLSGGF